MKNLDDLPEEQRQVLITSLLKSLGVGPIDAEDEHEPTIMIEGMDEGDAPDARAAIQGLLTHLVEKRKRKRQIRPATLDEVRAFNKPHEPPLQVGDRVRWRPGYRNARFPEDREVCIVSDVIDPPLRTDDPIERNDVALAFAPMEGEGVTEFVYDSRRLERVETPAE